MPLHRVLDLAILICKARIFFLERYHKNEKDYPKYPLLNRVGLQGGAMNILKVISIYLTIVYTKMMKLLVRD